MAEQGKVRQPAPGEGTGGGGPDQAAGDGQGCAEGGHYEDASQAVQGSEEHVDVVERKVIDEVDSVVTEGHIYPRVLGGRTMKQGFKPYHNS